MKLHLVNHVTGWVEDGQLVMLWRVVTEQGKPLCRWTTYAAAEAYRERLYMRQAKEADRANNPEWELCL